MKKLLMVGIAALFLLIGGGSVFAEEYKIYLSGAWQGVITVTKDTGGKITILPNVTYEGLYNYFVLTHSQCPLVPEGKGFDNLRYIKEIVIDGNTTTGTFSSDAGGGVFKEVVSGNTTTKTWSKYDWWEKWVVEGNTTTRTRPGVYPSTATVVDRQGYNIYIFFGAAYHLRLRGDEYSKQKDYDNAIADYTQAIRLEPNNEDAYYDRGRAYSAKGDYDRAIMDYSQAIRLDPNDAYNYANRGYVYAQKKDYRNAIPDYEAALRINPNLTSTKNNLENARKQVR